VEVGTMDPLTLFDETDNGEVLGGAASWSFRITNNFSVPLQNLLVED